MKYRRICFFGGPSVGKSSLAHHIISELKSQHRRVEWVPELIKPDAFEKRPPKDYDQVALFGNQLRYESVFLRNGADLVVCESPLLQCVVYGVMYNAPGAEALLPLHETVEEQYPSINFVLTYADGVPYDPEGRFQSVDEAVEVLARTLTLLDLECGLEYQVVTVRDRELVLSHIEEKLKQ